MRIIDTASTRDPALNLAIEEYALRNLDSSESYLLIYINEPSVIIGRNQNLYEEINYAFIKKQNIPVYRRISGGGAVYHDPGNINFSFITDYDTQRLNNYTEFNQPIIQALNALGIEAFMDDRNAIRVNDFKISGNAQFSASGRMFSHGTLLFNADLERLKKSLEPNMPDIHSSAHKSVRSEIINICDLLDHPMSLTEFKTYLLEQISRDPSFSMDSTIFDEKAWKEIQRIKENRYDRWTWNAGKSPRFSLQKQLEFEEGMIDLALEVKKGYINWISLDSDYASGPFLHAIQQALVHCRFTPEDIQQSLDNAITFDEQTQFPKHFVSALFQTSA